MRCETNLIKGNCQACDTGVTNYVWPNNGNGDQRNIGCCQHADMSFFSDYDMNMDCQFQRHGNNFGTVKFILNMLKVLLKKIKNFS